MRQQVYDRLMMMQASRRGVLKGAASAGALAVGGSGMMGMLAAPAAAQGDLRAQILQIPGVGKGQPTDADLQKVGELCLGATKANVKEGEFKGVELTFMGLNNQNLHNVLFRGFLKPWEAYTGAKINWIDLAQADYNPRLQQSIATGTVDFDIIEMGAPFEGDVCGKGLASEMPDWVKKQIDMDDYRGLPASRRSAPGTARPTASPSTAMPTTSTTAPTCSPMPTLAKAWKDDGGQGEWGVPKTWQQVQAVTKFLKGKKINGQDVYGYLDAPKPWGGFGFYFLGSRATAYAKHPDDKAWLFDVDTMKPRINNPAWVRAIQDVIDALPSEPPDQINADPNQTALPAVPGRHRLDARLVGRCRLQRQDQRFLGHRRRHRLLDPARLGRRLQFQDRAWDKLASGPNYAPNMAYLGWGVYVMARVDSDEKKKKAAWSAAAHLGGKDLSLWCAAYPSGFQPYRNSHFNIPGMGRGGLRRGVHHLLPEVRGRLLQPSRTRRSSRAFPASSSTTAWPRTSWPRSSPARWRRRPAPTPSPRPGRSSPTRSAATTRSSSTRPRSACRTSVAAAGSPDDRSAVATPFKATGPVRRRTANGSTMALETTSDAG